MSSGGAALQPTFQGHVATTQDALILFEACLQGHLSHVPRRPHDRERSSLIRSGCVFIYEENASGIKRWTDGVTWSPSRILGNFLVYRELDKPFPPGEKKRAMKKPTRRPSRPGEPYPSPLASEAPPQSYGGGDRTPSEVERQLIGSLIDSYGFKADGLVKKTMSVTVQGVTHHLVSYYNVHDVIANNLRTPSQTENLQYIRPRPELTSKQSFRSPIEDAEEVDGIRDAQGRYGYGVTSQGYVQDYRAPYSMPQYYPPMSQAPPGGYSSGPPPMQSPYMHSAVNGGQLPPQRQEYGHYEQQGYSRSYENLNSANKSVPPTPTSIPPMMPGREQPMMYPPPNVQRPMNNLSPVPMDSRNVPYRPSPYMGPGQSPIDGHRQSEQSPHIKYEERRESGSQPGQMYDNSRGQYYGGNSTPQMHQAPYPQSQPMTQWPAPSHPQQQ